MFGLMNILRDFWATLAEMGPYLLFGFLVAGILSVLISPQSVARHLGGQGLKAVLKAALFGIPLPLCSCGVIPVAASLRRNGASRGATVAFLLSTPQTGVDSIAVTYSLLGPVMTIFRPLAALVTGIVGGQLVNMADKGSDGGAVTPSPESSCTDSCCAAGSRSSLMMRILRHAFVTLPHDIARPMVVGLLLSALIGALVPNDFFAGILETGVMQILVMAVVGIPLYVCATASVPIAAVLIAKGISPGAALAFLIAGPATNAAAVTTIWKVLGHRTALIYIGTVAAAAIGFGLLLDGILPAHEVRSYDMICHSVPSLFQHFSAVVVLAILGAALWRPPHKKHKTILPDSDCSCSRI